MDVSIDLQTTHTHTHTHTHTTIWPLPSPQQVEQMVILCLSSVLKYTSPNHYLSHTHTVSMFYEDIGVIIFIMYKLYNHYYTITFSLL